MGVPGPASCILAGSLVSLRPWGLRPLSHCIHLLRHGKKKKKKKIRLSGTIKTPADCRSCDLAGALTYCSFLSPYLGFVGIKFNQKKQKTKPVLVCLLIFGFVFTFAREKQKMKQKILSNIWLTDLELLIQSESESEVAQSCLTLRPVDCSPPSSSVHGILQARILERVAIPFSKTHT